MKRCVYQSKNSFSVLFAIFKLNNDSLKEARLKNIYYYLNKELKINISRIHVKKKIFELKREEIIYECGKSSEYMNASLYDINWKILIGEYLDTKLSDLYLVFKEITENNRYENPYLFIFKDVFINLKDYIKTLEEYFNEVTNEIWLQGVFFLQKMLSIKEKQQTLR